MESIQAMILAQTKTSDKIKKDIIDEDKDKDKDKS